MQDLEAFLMNQFRPELAGELRVRVKFVWGEGERERCQIAIEEGVAQMSADSMSDVTLVFASASLLQAILLGQKSALDHFLTGEFRSDGGLPLVFPILQAFTGRGRSHQPEEP